MNGEDRKISPRKILLAVIITGVVIVASVGGVFQVANSAGIFSANVYVNGYVEYSVADQVFLFIDGIKADTNTMGNGYYDYYYQNSYSFYNIDVKANEEHTFQVITSDSEESNIITEYTPFGESTHISINIVVQKTRVYVEGTYKDNNSGSVNVALYVDGASLDNYYVYGNGDTYSFSAEVAQNQEHMFKVQTTGYNMYSNQTNVYIGTVVETITMDLP